MLQTRSLVFVGAMRSNSCPTRQDENARHSRSADDVGALLSNCPEVQTRGARQRACSANGCVSAGGTHAIACVPLQRNPGRHVAQHPSGSRKFASPFAALHGGGRHAVAMPTTSSSESSILSIQTDPVISYTKVVLAKGGRE